MSKRVQTSFRRRAAPGVAAILAALVLGACKQAAPVVTGSIPLNYWERHPIRLVENQHDVQLLIGSGTGVLTADQRAQVAYMAGTWRQEGTGHIVVQTPHGSVNQRAASYAAREVKSILQASGMPARAIISKSYKALPESLGAVRLSYARIEAEAGPCGAWPEDIGAAVFPSLERMPPQFDNRQYWNFGCAAQNNLAATIANPEDLVQPRPETPPYAARRQTVIERYRAGESPSATYDNEDAQASEIGQ